MRDNQSDWPPPPGLCPQCQVSYESTPIPCPDGRPGCIVAHFALICPKCGQRKHPAKVEVPNGER